MPVLRIHPSPFALFMECLQWYRNNGVWRFAEYGKHAISYTYHRLHVCSCPPFYALYNIYSLLIHSAVVKITTCQWLTHKINRNYHFYCEVFWWISSRYLVRMLSCTSSTGVAEYLMFAPCPNVGHALHLMSTQQGANCSLVVAVNDSQRGAVSTITRLTAYQCWKDYI